MPVHAQRSLSPVERRRYGSSYSSRPSKDACLRQRRRGGNASTRSIIRLTCRRSGKTAAATAAAEIQPLARGSSNAAAVPIMCSRQRRGGGTAAAAAAAQVRMPALGSGSAAAMPARAQSSGLPADAAARRQQKAAAEIQPLASGSGNVAAVASMCSIIMLASTCYSETAAAPAAAVARWRWPARAQSVTLACRRGCDTAAATAAVDARLLVRGSGSAAAVASTRSSSRSPAETAAR